MDKQGLVQVTVVICTRNFTAQLQNCLESLTTQTLPKEQYSILIVDNSSSDNIRDLATDLAGSATAVSHVLEPRPSLAVARNTALSHVQTPYIAYIGEAAKARNDWLQKLLKPFSQEQRPAAVGGELAPVWRGERPDWLTDRWLRSYSASLNWSTTARFLEEGDWLCDSNICFDTQLLRQAGGFSVRLGDKGDNLPACNRFVEQHLKSIGKRFFFEPGAVVDQEITAENLTPKWLGRQQFWQGVADAMLAETAANLGQTGPGWTEMRLPVSHWDWSALINLLPDSRLESAINHGYQAGYALQKAGLIA
jgi:hypothetical protein